MNSKNAAVKALQIKLHQDIVKKREALEKEKARIREKYPVDGYGIKAEMKISDLEDKYLPYIHDMEWYARAFSQLVEMHEGEDNENG